METANTCCYGFTTATAAAGKGGRKRGRVAKLDLPMTGAYLPEDVRATFLTSNASAYFGVPPSLGLLYPGGCARRPLTIADRSSALRVCERPLGSARDFFCKLFEKRLKLRVGRRNVDARLERHRKPSIPRGP